MAKDWIQSVDKEMQRKGTVGAFTKQAKRAGMSVHDFAMKVKDSPKDFSERTRKRAELALTFEKLADKKKKYMHGGKTQGYNDQLDESLATRLAPEKEYKQSMKDRRDESKAANKTLGRRAYSSVRAMDRNDRMMMEGGEMEYKHGGKVHKQGYADEQDESLGMRTGAESTKKQSMKARRDDSYGKFGKRDEEDRDITMARGGSVKGKIDRDRYVKLQREKKKEVAKLKKEKGALRKDLREKTEVCENDISELEKELSNLEYYAKEVAPKDKGKVSTDKNSMLMGGVLGLFAGLFFINR